MRDRDDTIVLSFLLAVLLCLAVASVIGVALAFYHEPMLAPPIVAFLLLWYGVLRWMIWRKDRKAHRGRGES